MHHQHNNQKRKDHSRHGRSNTIPNKSNITSFCFVLCRIAVTLAVLSRSGSWSASAFSPGSLPTGRTRSTCAGGVVGRPRMARQQASISGNDLSLDHRGDSSRDNMMTSWIETKQKLRSFGRKPSSLDVATTTKTTATTTTTALPPISKIDIGTFGIHFCAAVTMTLPVMIVPMMDLELLAGSTAAAAASTTAAAVSLAAMMATWAPLGNGIGKLVNGVVCQAVGGRRSSKLYFVGSIFFNAALASLTLTAGPNARGFPALLTPQYLGLIVAGLEFCASIQWTVCSLFLSRHHRHNPAAFARGITILSLSSTTGQIAAKVVGAGLLQRVHWRWVARLSVIMAMVGWNISAWTSRNMKEPTMPATMATMATTNTTEIVDAAPVMKSSQAHDNNNPPTKLLEPTIRQSVQRVVSSKIFWMIGLAHVSGYLTRTSDRILGSFLQQITSLSRTFLYGVVRVV